MKKVPITSDKFWDDVYVVIANSEQSPFTKALHEKIISLIPEDVSSILDAGCGGGALMANLSQNKKWDLAGIDLSEKGIEYLSKEMKLKAQVGSITNIDFPDNSFDLVICSEVLEHLSIDDIKLAVSELERVAKKFVIITNPYKENLNYHQVKCAHCKSTFHMAGHIWSIAEDFFAKILSGKNYKIHYSGRKEWRSNYYADFFRAIGGNVISMESQKCHFCGHTVDNKPALFRHLLSKAHSALQLISRKTKIGTRPSNIIAVINK